KRTIEGRLQALGRAQVFVAPDFVGGVDMRDHLTAQLSTFGARLSIAGPPLTIGGPFAQKLALIVHELATNAAKYGALSHPAGRVAITWKVEASPAEREPRLTLSWVERGGPRVEPPAQEGFGMKLISMLLDDAQRVSFSPSGLECEIVIPLSE